MNDLRSALRDLRWSEVIATIEYVNSSRRINHEDRCVARFEKKRLETDWKKTLDEIMAAWREKYPQFRSVFEMSLSHPYYENAIIFIISFAPVVNNVNCLRKEQIQWFIDQLFPELHEIRWMSFRDEEESKRKLQTLQ